MSIEVKVPVLPESVADAVIASWYKKVGDSVEQDEKLVDLETDKVILEVPAIQNGVIEKIMFQEGATVTSEQVLAIINETAVIETVNNAASNTEENTDDTSESSDHSPISPSARKLMSEHNISIDEVKGTGKGGRVLREDIQKIVESIKPGTAIKTSTSTTGKPVGIETGRIEKRVPMTRLRARIAERLVDAQHNAAMLTTFNEVNMKPVMELRKRYKEQFEKEHGVRLGFMSFFAKAVVEALKKFPVVNASIDGNEIVYHGYIDIGVAVSGANGLVVPVLKDTDKMSLAKIESSILEYAGKAKDNKIAIEDITGGTFTISNGGVFGSMLSTPILNPPQSAILGMHTIKNRPMVENGEVVVLPVMYLALSYDHRIIDGREAVQFLVSIKESIEDPARMLLEL